MGFAERLRHLREDINLNQSELAKLLNISRQSISNYENGARFPNDEKLILRIAQFFGVSIDYLLGVTNIRNYYSFSQAERKNTNIKETSCSYNTSKSEALEDLFYEVDDLSAEVINKITATIRLFKNK
jgi:transcriptional regulator with XRE-family HTH domain